MIIKSATYIISSPAYTQCPEADKAEYAFIGRSNVGKSTLINMLCDNQKVAKVSNTPGKTQLINHFIIESLPADEGQKRKVDKWYLVDLPGYGFAKVSKNQRKNWEKMIKDYLQHRPNLVTVFLLIDSRLSPQQIDLDFINQLGEWQIPFALVFTKADKITQSETAKNVKNFMQTLKKNWEELPPHFVTSSVKKLGRNLVLNYIDKLNKDFEMPPTA
jgi:GTP-binding protein